jgi:hypothetical protein
MEQREHEPSLQGSHVAADIDTDGDADNGTNGVV